VTRRRSRGNGKFAGSAVAAGLLLAASRGHALLASGAAASTAASPASEVAVAFARAQLGRPYLWGGTGPDAYDCSGLVQAAWQHAGVSIARTSQDQWATLPHVAAANVRPGDLVFFPGSDGTFAAPGHVALVIGGGRMIQAYATGTPIEVSPLSGADAGGITGYARPGAS
jgi:peptidoglycan DL-endopeptidase CwlO